VSVDGLLLPSHDLIHARRRENLRLEASMKGNCQVVGTLPVSSISFAAGNAFCPEPCVGTSSFVYIAGARLLCRLVLKQLHHHPVL